MLFIFTAIYYEAQIFIERYNLKKAEGNTRFQHFCNETADIRLTVTGVGEIAAAAAVSSICTKYQPQANDFLLNIGICSGITEKEGSFLIHKMTEQATGKTFYPDILFKHPFREGSLVTGRVPWNGQEEEVCFGGALYDMEAAAVYQTGSYFFGPHQMIFLKIVSDYGAPDSVTPKKIRQLMAGQDRIFEYLNRLLNIDRESRRQASLKVCREDLLIEKFCLDLHCSKTMADSLRGHIRYFTLAGIDYKRVIKELYQENRLPCRDKREGKKCFEEFKNRLL